MFDYKLTDEQKREVSRLMKDFRGELELIIEFKGKKMSSLSQTATFDDITNVITELTEKMSKVMQIAMQNVGITEQQIKSSLSSEDQEKYLKCKFPMALKVKYMGDVMIMTTENILAHQLAEAFESMSLTIQRGIDNAKNGIFESNMVKVKEIK